jgi:proteasome accessory factor A
MSALEMQTEIVERALKYRDTKGLDAEGERALDLWASTLDGLWRDPHELWRSIDWVSKYRLMAAFADRNHCDLDHPKMEYIDLMYHDIDPQRGLFYRLEARGQADRILDDSEIMRAVSHAPETTRARLRGAFVRRAKEQRRDFSVDWVHLKLNDQAQRTLTLKNPFKSHDERVEKLIESL